MLQQTQVATVIPYFERFVTRFPEVGALAAAPLDEPLHLWTGLGYYARARNLHRAAQLVCERHAGRLPMRLDALTALPGIGRSTAGAILALAGDEPQPILDGNVRRLLARCFAVPGWPGRSAVQRALWSLAEALLPDARPADYTQGLMDLGALVCTARAPRCNDCPLAGRCRARLLGEPTAFPAPRPRRAIPQRRVRLVLVQASDRGLLLERRPPAGVWGGLWCPPECAADDDPVAWCTDRLGITTELVATLPPRRHSFSHYRLEMIPTLLRPTGPDARVMEGPDRVWYNFEHPQPLGLAAPIRRLLDELDTAVAHAGPPAEGESRCPESSTA